MVKINRLEIENVKRIKALALTPTENGLTVIGGKNRQGKTSVLDAIAWALGGDRYRPEAAQRDGSILPPKLSVTLSNGLIVERGGKNGSLKVTDPSGRKGGQQLLNEFVEQLALDLPKFLAATDREKSETLLRIIGVGEELHQLERKEQELYNKRHTLGQLADQKAKYAKELPSYPDVSTQLVSAAELIRQQQAILARNGENQQRRDYALRLQQRDEALSERLEHLQKECDSVMQERKAITAELEQALAEISGLADESTAELEKQIESVEETNRKVRANLDKEKAEEDAKELTAQYDALTVEIENTRNHRRGLLEGADLPFPGLSVEDGALTYQGKRWSDISGADQLRIAAAIVRRLKPECGFVLLDKLEQMDLDTLEEFGAWLEQEGLQAIATRVSTGGECSVIIEDGQAAGVPELQAAPETKKKWKAGMF